MKSYDQPIQFIKKQRHYFGTKVRLVKAMVFSVVMHGCWELAFKESWALKNWCFWTVVLEKTLESPLDSKEIQPVHPKGNQSEYSLEGLMLKLQYFGHLIQRTDSLEKTLMLAKIEGRRRGRQWMTNGWMASLTQLSWVWVNSWSWWWTGCSPWDCKELDTTEWLNRTDTHTHTHTHTHTYIYILSYITLCYTPESNIL